MLCYLVSLHQSSDRLSAWRIWRVNSQNNNAKKAIYYIADICNSVTPRAKQETLILLSKTSKIHSSIPGMQVSRCQSSPRCSWSEAAWVVSFGGLGRCTTHA